jgi:hypothetical protein
MTDLEYDFKFSESCNSDRKSGEHWLKDNLFITDYFQFGNSRNDDSNYFSKSVHPWGWTTWSDRCAVSYNETIAKWPRIRYEGWLQ